ncbi:MAG: hypothetical protein KGP27_03125 [Hyphomicrobiales bacterium]|nr:hypothetical protein [Hyphomicrobiales bacterium]
MRRLQLTRGRRVETEADRELALAVLAETYLKEKGWVQDAETVFPASDLAREDVSWFIATQRNEPVGVLRVLYDPPIKAYLEYGLKPIGREAEILEFLANNKIAEIGRFAVVPARRNGTAVPISLMRHATREIVARGYSQLVTDVFENDPHSPLGFHTRILGFRPVATHEHGELLHKGRRITLLLDIGMAYRRLKARGNFFFRQLTKGWTEQMHRRLAA